MDPSRWRRIDGVFHEAAELPAAERAAFLERACAGDPALLAEVAALLAADARTDGYLASRETPVAPVAGGLAPGRRVGAWQVEELIGEGGMGLVYRAARADGQYEQHAALKVMRAGVTSEAARERFRVERQALARLDHPRIARLLDGGLLEEGSPYLVMELVDGEPIDAWCDRRRLGLEERLRLFLATCGAVAYAHQNLIVHRDIKPSNVLVGAEGRLRLVDFGIAKLLEDGQVELTVTGETPMTPEYASPEQVRGGTITTASDVYSLGVLLYRLVTGRRPYRGGTGRLSALEHAICEEAPTLPSAAVELDGERGGEPSAAERALLRSSRPGRLRRRLAGDLDNVILMALRKEPERRYLTVEAFAADVERYLSGFPVQARGDAWGYRLRRFFGRHRVATVVGTAVLTAAVGLALREMRAAHRDRQQLDEIRRLADAWRLTGLQERAHKLWPPLPRMIPHMESWLAEGDQVAVRLPLHQAALAELSSLGTPAADGSRRFADDERAWRHSVLQSLVEELAKFCGDDWRPPSIASVERRLTQARTIEEESIRRYARAWDDAITAIADPTRLPVYGGLRLTPQLGLVPLGIDPESGLFEFWHVPSGERPERDAHGRHRVGEESGIVLVLLPGGRCRVGAQSEDPLAPHHDPFANVLEQPVSDVDVGPFFLSKYELTQGQFQRAAGANPSLYAAGVNPGGKLVTRANPVERFSWFQAVQILWRLDLELPTRTQWEYAARGGQSFRFGDRDDTAGLDQVANLADRFCRRHGERPDWSYDDSLDDGFATHAPVGSFVPNAFGLHDMLGNVSEWVLEGDRGYWLDGPYGPEPGQFDDLPGYRGGDYGSTPRDSRVSTHIRADSPYTLDGRIGARPARPLR